MPEAKSILTQALEKARSPLFFYSASNVACAFVGLLQAVLTANILGPALIGITAIIAGINGVALNFLDVRLVDLATKLYYRREMPNGITVKEYQASVIQMSFLVYTLLGALFFVTGFLANYFIVHLFTSSEVSPRWFLANALFMSLWYVVGPLGYMQRFSGKFYHMGAWRFVAAVTSTGVFAASLLTIRSLDGYYLGIVLSSIINFVIMAALSVYILQKYEHLPLTHGWYPQALHDFFHSKRFLFFGNLFGYVKLGHRSADVLAVGYFCNDSITGLYKFARSILDSILVLFDSMNQVYQPRFMNLIKENAFEKYRLLAKRVMVGSAVFTVLVLLSEYTLLPLFIKYVLAGKFYGAQSAVMLLSATFFFVAGMHTWMWPLYVSRGQIGIYTMYSIGALAAQYLVGVGLFIAFGSQSVNWFACGYLSYYLVLFTLTYFQLRQAHPQATPFAGYVYE